MHAKNLFSALLIPLLFLLFTPSFGQQKQNTIRVGYILHSPFVIKKDDTLIGMSIDIWELIAKKLKWNYIYEKSPFTLKTGFEALNENKIDVLIGAIPVDKQGLNKVTFSRPYFINRIGLLSLYQTRTFWDYFHTITHNLINAKLFLILVIFIGFCHLLWLSERGVSLPKKYFKGIGHATWLGFTTFVINDAGSPKKMRTRVILSLWFLLSVTTLATFTASITSALTMSLFSETKVLNMETVFDKPVAVIDGVIDKNQIKTLSIKPVYTETLTSAIQLLNEKKVVAIIDDVPNLKYYLSLHPSKKLQISSEMLGYEEYSFAFQKNSHLVEPFDFALDDSKSGTEIKELCEAYVSEEGAPLCLI